MELLERPEFPLLNETLNYLDNDLIGKVINIVRSKNNKLIIHMTLPKCEKIDSDDINLALLNEEYKPLSEVQPGTLLGCLHPQHKKWMRCYVVSILLDAYVALCDTGEMTKTKRLKNIPDRYKSIPIITFEAEVQCICPYGKLRHLMENFKDYIGIFKPFMNNLNIKTHKKMKLVHKYSSINLIIKKWDLQNSMNNNDTYSSRMFKNGSTVTIAKPETYNSRHIFIRNAEKFINVCKHLQNYCENASSIQSDPIVGDVIAVKCIDKFYRGKILDVLDTSSFSVYLIDTGCVISASVDCIVDLSETLKKIPSTVCLVGLKNINFKPWTPEAYLYISALFENSTAMILEYTDFDTFGLDSVTLTIINNNEDVNGYLTELLKCVEDPQNDDGYISLNPFCDDDFTHLKSDKIIPVKAKNLIESVMPEPVERTLLPRPGSIVYMTSFVTLNEIYIRMVEDHNNEFDNFLDMVNAFCLSATPINRPLIIGEILGAKSTLDNSYYRGKVLKKIDDTRYLIQYIDFGDQDDVPISNLFDIPSNFMIPSNVMKITLKGVKLNPMNTDALNYITNLLSNYEPMIIELPSKESPNDVTLTILNNNENVNERLNELLNTISSSPTEIVGQIEPEKLNFKENMHNHDNFLKLKNGDWVKIVRFANVHRIFIRKVEDITDEFLDFIEKVEKYCAAETPIGKLPKVNDIIGAKSIADGLFYRAKVLKKVNDVSYDVIFIDCGIEENVSLFEIVALPTELKQVIPTIILVKLKDIPVNIVNEDTIDYINSLCQNETLMIYDIENNNEVILKTDKNENVNDHFNMLMSGNQFMKENNTIRSKEIEEELKIDSSIHSFSKCHSTIIVPGSIVYMTAFIDLNEMYIRKMEDYNDDYHNFLDKVNEICSSAVPINRPLVIDEIIGAQSSLDNSFYRGKVMKQIDEISYLIQFIDFGDKDVIPVSNLFEIPEHFMIPSTVTKINLKGIKSCALNVEASNYITNLLSTYEPMIIDFDTTFPLKDVTLVVINNNENVSDKLNTFFEVVDNIAVGGVIKDVDSIAANRALEYGDNIAINGFVEKEENIALNGITEDIDNIEVNGVTENINNIDNIAANRALEYGDNNAINEFVNKKENIAFNEITEDIDNIEANVVTENMNNIEAHKSFDAELTSKVSVVSENIFKDKNYFNDTSLLKSGDIVYISAYCDANNIYIRKVSDFNDDFHKLNKRVNTYCSLGNTSESKLPELYQIVGAKCSNDGYFYRARIMNKTDEKNYDVLFFDFGFEENINVANIVLLPSPLQQPNSTTLVIGLKGLTVKNFNEEGHKYFESLMLDQEMMKIEFENLSSATLITVSQEQNVNDYLNKLHVDDTMVVNNSAQSVSNMENTSHCVTIPQIPPLINKSIVTIYAFVSINDIYISIPIDKSNFNKFSKEFTVFCLNSLPINRYPAVGEIFGIRSSTDGSFNRGAVLEKINDQYKVVFFDIGTEDIVSADSLVEIPEELKKIPRTIYSVSLKDVHSNNFNAQAMSYINMLCENMPLIIEFDENDPNGLNAVTLTTVKTHQNVNSHLAKLLIEKDGESPETEVVCSTKVNTESKIQTNLSFCSGDFIAETENPVIKYYIPPLEVPIQVWVAEKISSSKYLVYTYENRIEFLQLEKQIFEDSKSLKSIKSIKINKPCIIYFSPSWYRGEIIEVIDTFNAKVRLVDVGNFSVTRNIKEIFHMPSKYKGKSLLLNIEIQPEPQEKLSITTFKIAAKNYLDNTIIVEVVKFPINQSYDDLDNVGLPSFSSTPIPEDSDHFQYNSNSKESVCTPMCSNSLSPPINISSNKRLPNILTIKDVQYAKWQKGTLKTITFLCIFQDYFIMRDHLIDDTLTDLETKIQHYCYRSRESYSPAENELCLAKYCDELWYRAICIKTTTPNDEKFLVYFLDWGIEYLVNAEDICKMPKDFVYLPATAHKCYVKGISLSECSVNTMDVVNTHLVLTQINCEILDKLSSDIYIVSCDIIKHLVNSNLQ